MSGRIEEKSRIEPFTMVSLIGHHHKLGLFVAVVAVVELCSAGSSLLLVFPFPLVASSWVLYTQNRTEEREPCGE